MLNLEDKKILIFSDTHLTCKFEKEKFNALKKIIEKSDQVIINGDFWECFSCSFEDFINSEWSIKLFPLLKNKNTILIHGNHDHERDMSWDGISLFAQRREKSLDIKSGDKIFKIEHGDLIALEFDDKYRFIIEMGQRFLSKLYVFSMNYEYEQTWLAKKWHSFLLRSRKRDREYFKKYSLENKGENMLRIFGHIHTLYKHNFDDNFMILGEFKNGVENYIFIKNGDVEFFHGRYKKNK